MRRPLLLAALGLAVVCPSASAAPIVAPCAGTTGDTAGLIAAINQANTAPGPDSVVLGQGCTYTFIQQSNGWYGLNALPAIKSDVTIEGNGATLERAAVLTSFRFFFVGADPTDPDTLGYVTPGAGSLTIRDLTLRGGVARGGSSGAGGGGSGMGGAIFNQGTLVIERSTFVENAAVGGASGTSAGNGGGGMAIASNSGNGGGMGGLDGAFAGSMGGAGGTAGGGGGAGLREGQPGTAGTASLPGDGGGERSGTGGFGGGISGGMSGEGSGGGGNVGATGNGSSGGRFSDGGNGLSGGGGGGAGGGGGSGSPGSGGGGGFGGGGGWGLAAGGAGGFGGGGATAGSSGIIGAPGFGGGSATLGPSRSGGGAGFGGAVFNMQGSVTVVNSTFVGNSATGGEPLDLPDPGKGMGGAVFNMSGSFVAVGSTFAQNSASDRGTTIYNLVYDSLTERLAQVTLRDTIVARGTGAPEDLVSDETDYNLVPERGKADASIGERNIVQTGVGREDGTISGTALTADPLLQALASNGGPTQTMLPGAGSPALDAGSAFGLTTDQRGLARPSDLPAIANFSDGADIGAVEVQAPAPPAGPPAVPPALQAFGAKTLVTISAADRIRRRSRLPVIVRNRNKFAVTGSLSGRRRSAKIRSRPLNIAARGRARLRLRLPRAIRRILIRRGRVTLRLTATVRDPASNRRKVTRRVTVRLRAPVRR